MIIVKYTRNHSVNEIKCGNIIMYYEIFIVCSTGPLLYHFADMPSELSIELCYEDVHRIAEEIGFQFLVSTIYHLLLLLLYKHRRNVQALSHHILLIHIP